MVLIAHPPVDCGGGNAPIDPSTIGKDAPIDLQAASLEMTRDYTSAPIFVRPSSNNGVPPTGHPRAVFDQSDPKAWEILSTWAAIP
jgi:hypothetical protein